MSSWNSSARLPIDASSHSKAPPCSTGPFSFPPWVIDVLFCEFNGFSCYYGGLVLKPAPTGNLLTFLSQVPDPRGRQGRRHSLVVCAMLQGARSYSAISQWVHNQEVELWHALGYTRWPPKLIEGASCRSQEESLLAARRARSEPLHDPAIRPSWRWREGLYAIPVRLDAPVQQVMAALARWPEFA